LKRMLSNFVPQVGRYPYVTEVKTAACGERTTLSLMVWNYKEHKWIINSIVSLLIPIE